MSAAMAEALLLLRLRLRLLLRPGVSGRGGGRRRYNVRLLAQVVVLVAVGLVLASSLGQLLSGALGGPVGRLLLEPALTWISSGTTLFLFLLAVPVVLALFTYSSDLKLLLLTPLSPRLIMGEKFLSVFGSLTFTLLAVGLIVVLGVGQAMGLGPGYALTAILALLLLPVAPLSLAMLLTVSTLHWVPPARARTITALLGALFGIAAYVGVHLIGNRSNGLGGGDGFARWLSGSAQLWWSTLPPAWPGRALAAAGLSQTGAALAYLAATALLSGVLAGLAILLSAHLFATGWATYQEVGRRPPATPAPVAPPPGRPAAWVERPPTVDEGAGPVVASHRPRAAPALVIPVRTTSPDWMTAWWPLICKEWRTLRRDTQVWARLLYPLFVLGFGFYQALTRSAGGRNSAVGGGFSLLSVGFLVYILLIILILPVVNREGRALYLLALAPLRARDIVLSKWIFCAAPVLVLAEAVLVVDAIAQGIPLGATVLIAAAVASLVVALAGALLVVSLTWPRLDWDNPRRQVSGTASLVGSLGGLLLMVGTGALLVLTGIWASSRPLAAVAAGISLFALTALISAASFVIAPRRLAALMAGTTRRG